MKVVISVKERINLLLILFVICYPLLILEIIKDCRLIPFGMAIPVIFILFINIPMIDLEEKKK